MNVFGERRSTIRFSVRSSLSGSDGGRRSGGRRYTKGLRSSDYLWESEKGFEEEEDEEEEEFYLYPYPDTLYDFRDFVASKKDCKPIATGLPTNAKVAVVGCGAAGITASYELMRAGLTPHIYEASDRVAGRLWSAQHPNDPNNMFELGGMRFPMSSRIWWDYCNKFDVEGQPEGSKFPNPGEVTTTLLYRNMQLFWTGGADVPPDPFKKIRDDLFDLKIGWLYTRFIYPYTVSFEGGEEAVKILWQHWLDDYANKSFYTCVIERMTKAPYNWTAEHMNQFGSLGLGSGGFAPLFPVGFLEMIRLLACGLEETQRAIPSGAESVLLKMLDAKDSPEGHSLNSSGQLYMENYVRSINKESDGKLTLHVLDKGKMKQDGGYDAVIVATTTRAMQDMGLTESNLLSTDVKTALRNLHMTNASKLFLRTKDKFWLKNKETVPQNIQTDALPRGIYCVDYPEPDGTVDPDKPGCLLLSYTWGDDSDKLIHTREVGAKERYKKLYKTLIKAPHHPVTEDKNGQLALVENFITHLPTPDEVLEENLFLVDWQATKHHYGAFKLNYPGQDPWCAYAYYQFKTCLNKEKSSYDEGNPYEFPDSGVYLAGDGVSWIGGWVEGAMETGLNCAAAVVTRLGGKMDENNPLIQDETTYNYFGTHMPGK